MPGQSLESCVISAEEARRVLEWTSRGRLDWTLVSISFRRPQSGLTLDDTATRRTLLHLLLALVLLLPLLTLRLARLRLAVLGRRIFGNLSAAGGLGTQRLTVLVVLRAMLLILLVGVHLGLWSQLLAVLVMLGPVPLILLVCVQLRLFFLLLLLLLRWSETLAVLIVLGTVLLVLVVCILGCGRATTRRLRLLLLLGRRQLLAVFVMLGTVLLVLIIVVLSHRSPAARGLRLLGRRSSSTARGLGLGLILLGLGSSLFSRGLGLGLVLLRLRREYGAVLVMLRAVLLVLAVGIHSRLLLDLRLARRLLLTHRLHALHGAHVTHGGSISLDSAHVAAGVGARATDGDDDAVDWDDGGDGSTKWEHVGGFCEWIVDRACAEELEIGRVGCVVGGDGVCWRSEG